MTPQDFHEFGLSVIPCSVDKKPLVKSWKKNQTEIIRSPVATHYGIVCGAVSGNLECIDYDIKHDPTNGEIWAHYKNLVSNTEPELLERLLLERSVSGGIHIVYRCVSAVDKNQKLAATSDGRQTYFETRGEGGYYICAGSVGYDLLQGTYDKLPVITQQERALLLDAARALSLFTSEQGNDRNIYNDIERQDSPLDDYDERADVVPLLCNAGWKIDSHSVIQGRTVTYLTRPGKDKGISASYNYIPRRLFVFSSNAYPFNQRVYRPCAVYALLNHEGDFSKAARVLRNQGYGTKDEEKKTIDINNTDNDYNLNDNSQHNYVIQSLYRDEVGDAELYARVKHGKIVYDHAQQKWYRFAEHDNKHWISDNTDNTSTDIVETLTKEYGEAIQIEQLKLSDVVNDETKAKFIDSRIKYLKARIKALYKTTRIDRVKKYLAKITGVKLVGTEWDSNLNVLGVTNGAIDLLTGQLREVSASDYVRTVAPTAYIRTHMATRFKQFMAEICGGNDDKKNYIQMLFGYALLGRSTEHILPILYGEHGRNGKDTLVHVLQHVLGNALAKTISRDAIIQGKRSGAASEELYDLWGVRIGWVNESEESSRLKIADLKALSGGSLIRCRPLYGHSVEFMPTHLLILITNHLPAIPVADHATWKRIKVITFTESFVEKPTKKHEHEADKNLLTKLYAESSGILNWLIDGCLEYQAIGTLPTPKEVTDSTENLRMEFNTVRAWLDAVCDVGPLLTITDSDAYRIYCQWCAMEHYQPVTKYYYKTLLLMNDNITFSSVSATTKGRGYVGFDVPASMRRQMETNFTNTVRRY